MRRLLLSEVLLLQTAARLTALAATEPASL
jgi:hypothetical protein